MMRGGNRQMRRMMDKMGLDMTEIPNVQEVIIKTTVINNSFSRFLSNIYVLDSGKIRNLESLRCIWS